MAAVDLVHDYISALPGESRRLAHTEWGVTVPADQAEGWPLDIGLRIHEGLLRVQAFAASADEAFDPWLLLHWNRQTRMARFSCTRDRDIWVQADLPVTQLDEERIDALLGLVAEGAGVVRRFRAAAHEHSA
ncbi:MAG: YbjN domain-containing protein [Thermoleophilaceae bacterium]|nr:YbjN domain-containing protein [Thermoleophilaceae bacterium]